MRSQFTLKTLAGLFVAFAIALLVLFLWEEKLDISLKINDGKVSNYLSSIGAFAAALSIYLLYRQLKEMEKARKRAVEPDLYLATTQLKVQDKASLGISPVDQLPYVRICKYEPDVSPDYSNTHIQLHNIGLGAAKNISIVWLYDKEEVNALIKGKYMESRSEYGDSQKLDFLVPKDSTPINIPHCYFVCCGERLNDDGYPSTSNEEFEKPLLKVQIDYEDIEGQVFRKVFIAKVTALLNLVTIEFQSGKEI